MQPRRAGKTVRECGMPSGRSGAYYVGDDEESCISQDLIVNAWKPLPEPYRKD